jgi:hypothetical protein
LLELPAFALDSGLIVAIVGFTGAERRERIAPGLMTASSVTIRPVANKADRKAFVDLAW